jgi:hypothetical protein
VNRNLVLGIFLTFFIAIAVAAACLPRKYIFRGAPDGAAWRDLRWWSALLVGIHVVVYWYLS